MRRALVTGAGGFVGQWLCRALVRGGWEVTGATLGPAPDAAAHGDDPLARVDWRSLDLRPGTDRRTLRALVERAAPSAVFHLAGVAFVPAAGADPERALETNVGAAVRLIAAVRAWREAGGGDPTLLVVGSGEQYGRHPAEAQPLGESSAQAPMSFYAATKCAQEQFAMAAVRTDGLRVVATRSFNHSGRGQDPGFLLPALVRRAVEARRAPGAAVPVGNTAPIRDFLHVEDVVGAYIALVERGRPGEVYNVCSGEGVAVGTVAAEVLARAGVDPSALRPDPALQRPVDVPVLVGDNSKLRAETGWSPSRTRADIIDDLLDAAS